MVNKQDDTSDHANQRRITTFLVRNTFNSTNMQSSSAIARQEGQQQERLIQEFQPAGVLSYMSSILDENMEQQRLCSACSNKEAPDDKIVWDQNKPMSTLEILDIVLDLLDDHEYMYDHQHVLDDREDTKK